MLNQALTRSTSRDPFWGLVDRFFNEGFLNDSDRPSELAPVNRNWLPPVDIQETDEAFVVTADLPGLTKEDIDISLEDKVLTISGQRSYEKKEDKGAFRRVERAYGNFHRSFSLPAGVDVAKVDASFRDGVLSLTLPKAETAKVQKISVS